MSISSNKFPQDAPKIVPLPGNTGFENACPIVSVTDLTPEKICTCAKQLLLQVSNIKAMLQDPEKIVTCIWPGDSLMYGPADAGSSIGWWFRVYKPELKMGVDNLSIGLKCGVKKTRGILQFPWRNASHTFVVDIPTEISQYKQAITEIGKIEDVLNTIKNICQPLP